MGSFILEGVIRSGWPVTPLQGRGPSMAVLGPAYVRYRTGAGLSSFVAATPFPPLLPL
jgi:hypothetical protein